MDDVVDEKEKKYTVTVYYGDSDGSEVFNGCTEPETSDRQLIFIDKNNKSHEFFGVGYHIVQE